MPVTIRLATERDAESMLEILAPVIRDTVISFELTPPSADEFRGRIRDILRLAPWLVIDDGGAVAGYAYASSFRSKAAYRWTVETTIYLREGRRGRGAGRILYGALLECLRLQGFRTAIGGIAMPNDASAGLHEALGFRRVAQFPGIGFKHGGWVDVWFWALELSAADGPPAEPLSFAAVAATAAWRDVLTRAASALNGRMDRPRDK